MYWSGPAVGGGVLPSDIGLRQSVKLLSLAADVIAPGDIGLDNGLPP